MSRTRVRYDVTILMPEDHRETNEGIEEFVARVLAPYFARADISVTQHYEHGEDS